MLRSCGCKRGSVKSSKAVAIPRRNRAELAFLPAALEIVETPPSPLGRAIALTIAALFALAASWSFVGRVDIVSTANGKVIPTGRIKLIQPLETGVVRAIHVTDGQLVMAGDPLIELDPTADEADVQHVRGQLLAAQTTVARLRAALADASDPTANFHPPIGVPADLVAAERQQLLNEIEQYHDTLVALDRQKAEKEAERATASATIDGLKATLPVQEELVGVYQSLFKSGNGNRVQYLQTLATVTDQRHQLVAQRSHYAQTDAAVSAIVANRAEIIADYHRKITADLTTEITTAAGLSQDLIKAERRTRLQTLRAPVAGVVQQLAVHTIGGVVTPAQPLLVLVPLDSRLQIVAAVPNREIGFIHPGQPAQIKVNAFDYTQYGLLRGRVEDISRDTIATPWADETRRNSSSASAEGDVLGGELQYDAHIAINRSKMFVNGQSLDLRPGMAVTVEIKTGSRRIIDYLLSPFVRHSHESLHER